MAAYTLFQRQEFLGNCLARIPNTPRPKGTYEMSEAVLFIAGAQDMHTSDFEVSDLDDINSSGKILSWR